MPTRKCSECPELLEGKPPQTKTCSRSCRQKRSRRLKRQNREAAKQAAATPEQREIAERVRGELPDVAHEVIEEELRPVIRESLTDDVLRAIQGMVALTPNAVAAIAADLQSDNDSIRQRAYTLIMKYTVGHGAILQPEEADKNRPLEVNFHLPRPGAASEEEASEEVTEAIEVRTCDICEQEKPVTEFAANSDRCLACYDEQRARAAALVESTDGD